METLSDNRRIAKNTLFLYIRMGITMLVQLYTSRVVLVVLGIEDYGIWSLVATLVVSISFITGPLSLATQRFLSYEIGKNNGAKANVIFSQSMILYGLFSLILLFLLETIGLWLLNNKLQIPDDKLFITNIVYQFSIASFIVTLLRMPYDATIIAYEKMGFYAFMSILDAFLKLGIVFLLSVIKEISFLLLYGILTLITTCIITIIYKLYCNYKYDITRLLYQLDKSIIKSMASFSGWSIMGAFAVMTANQGISMILNVFFGVAINATIGITNQVGNAVNQFVSNFQTAFNPQIIKVYAKKEIDRLIIMISDCSKMSFSLMLLIVVPLFFSMDSVLLMWLGTTPEYLSNFCRLTLIYMLIDTLSAPIYMGIYATGRIRQYQFFISLTFLLILPVSHILLKYDYPAIIVLYVRIINSVISLIIRIRFLNKSLSYSISIAYLKLILKLCFVTMVTCLLPYVVWNYWMVQDRDLSHLIYYFALSICWTFMMIFFISMNKREKSFIINFFKR